MTFRLFWPFCATAIFYTQNRWQPYGIQQALFKCNKNESSAKCVASYASGRYTDRKRLQLHLLMMTGRHKLLDRNSDDVSFHRVLPHREAERPWTSGRHP